MFQDATTASPFTRGGATGGGKRTYVNNQLLSKIEQYLQNVDKNTSATTQLLTQQAATQLPPNPLIPVYKSVTDDVLGLLEKGQREKLTEWEQTQLNISMQESKSILDKLNPSNVKDADKPLTRGFMDNWMKKNLLRYDEDIILGEAPTLGNWSSTPIQPTRTARTPQMKRQFTSQSAPTTPVQLYEGREKQLKKIDKAKEASKQNLQVVLRDLKKLEDAVTSFSTPS